MSDPVPLADVSRFLDNLSRTRYFGSITLVMQTGQVMHIEAKQILKKEEIQAHVT